MWCRRAEFRDGQLMIDEGEADVGDGGAAAAVSKQEAGDSKLEQFAIPSQLQQRHLEVRCQLLDSVSGWRIIMSLLDGAKVRQARACRRAACYV